MNSKQNCLEAITFGSPEYVPTCCPAYVLAYQGANHEGYAGGGHDCPVGTVYVGVSTAKETIALHLQLTGSRDRIRTLTVKHAVNAVRKACMDL